MEKRASRKKEQIQREIETMKVSYNWLQSFLKNKLPAPEKLAEILTMSVFEVGEIKKVGRDRVLDIDVLPNRAHDCLSHWGVAREVAAITGNWSSSIGAVLKKNCSNGAAPIKVEVKNKDLCPRYCARVITDIKVGPSPKWLKERLEVIGQKSINNIVDAANYVMFETGQPLHAFDMDKVGGSPRRGLPPRIIIRRAKKGEKIITLENEKYELNSDILVIADTKEPLAIAGIKGGKKAEIDQGTKDIILEAANFNPQNIRQVSKKLGLRTESSLRFEAGLDANLASEAIDRAADLIQKIAGGEIVPGLIDVYPKKIRPKKIKLEVEKVKRLLGVEIPKKDIIKILESLSFKIQDTKYKILNTIIPTWRLDITLPEDLIEEIGRLFGYEKIPAQLPSAALIPPERNDSLVYENKIREILVSAGLSEVYNYSFISEKDIITRPVLVELENPVSREQKYLRPSLMPNLLKNIKDNLRFFNEVGLFEIGKVFKTEDKRQKTEVSEEKKLAGVFALKIKSEGTREFYQLKGVVDSLLNKLRISDVWYDDANNKQQTTNNKQFYHSARRAEIKVGDDLVGWLGEISPEILERLDIKPRVVGFEIDFEKLVALATEEREYLPPSKYPAVVRDIAVLVEPSARVEEVLNLIETAGGPLVQDVDLFDMYEGENIPDGKKNLAFHIVYQAEDRTLTDKEVNDLHAKIVWTLENEGGWEVRK